MGGLFWRPTGRENAFPTHSGHATARRRDPAPSVIDPKLRTFEIKGLVTHPSAVPGAMADLLE